MLLIAMFWFKNYYFKIVWHEDASFVCRLCLLPPPASTINTAPPLLCSVKHVL